MSRIGDAFKNGKAFIPFITCGDPDIGTTAELIKEMEKKGAAIIELGIPFSDPTAEGPTIQEANIRALKNGITTDDVFEMVKNIRETVKIPLVFMTYANVVFSYGADRFLGNCEKYGIDGLILPDVPFEEKKEFIDVCRKHNVELISMIAPTSNERIKRIASEAEGFLYCVSSLGVTGVRNSITTDIGHMIGLAKSVTDVPCAVGFGISTPEQAADMAKHADGVIVGSAIVKLCGNYGKDCVEPVGKYVESMVSAIKN